MRRHGLGYLAHLHNLAAVHRALAGGGSNANRLAAKLGVDRRTVQRYFAALRQLGAPTIADPVAGLVRYRHRWNFGKALIRSLDLPT